MDFQETKAFLLEDAKFEDKQWRELQAICDIRMGNYSAKAGEASKIEVGDEYTRLLYGRLTNILLDQEKIGVAPLGVLVKAQPKQYADLKKLAARIQELSIQWNPDGVRGRNFYIGVCHWYAKLTAQWLKDCSVPLSMKAVLQHSDKFEGLMERSFPGYIKSGQLHIIILGQAARQMSA